MKALLNTVYINMKKKNLKDKDTNEEKKTQMESLRDVHTSI